MAQRLGDPVADLLVGMIVEDEQRHDALLRSMIRRLHEEVEFVASPDAVPVPTVSGLGTVEAAAEMAASVRGLMRNEHEGARHLRHLARQEPTLYGGLYPLLLETIARDSEKHATILRYLLHRDRRAHRMSAPAAYPAELEADVALRDGSIAHIRPIRAEDEPRLLAFLRELSDDDRRMRFFSLGNDLSRTAHDEADVDYVHSLGLLATVGSPERIVGHALYAPSGRAWPR